MFTNKGQVICDACGSHMTVSVIEIRPDANDHFDFVCGCGHTRNFSSRRRDDDARMASSLPLVA